MEFIFLLKKRKNLNLIKDFKTRNSKEKKGLKPKNQKERD